LSYRPRRGNAMAAGDPQRWKSDRIGRDAIRQRRR